MAELKDMVYYEAEHIESLIEDIINPPEDYAGDPWDTLFDYLTEALDIEYTIGYDFKLRGAKFWLTLGGPSVCFNSEEMCIEGYWGEERKCKYFNPYYNDTLYDMVDAIYYCSKEAHY